MKDRSSTPCPILPSISLGVKLQWLDGVMSVTQVLVALALLACLCEASNTSPAKGGGDKKDLAEFTFGKLKQIGEFALGYTVLTIALRSSVSILIWVVQPEKLGLVNCILPIMGKPVRSEQPHTIVDRLSAHYDHIHHHATYMLRPVSKCLHLDLKHLATAYAEASVLGMFLRPVVMPLKAYLTWRYLSNREKEKKKDN